MLSRGPGSIRRAHLDLNDVSLEPSQKQPGGQLDLARHVNNPPSATPDVLNEGMRSLEHDAKHPELAQEGSGSSLDELLRRPIFKRAA